VGALCVPQGQAVCPPSSRKDAKSRAHRARARAYAHFGALAGAKCALCDATEPDATLVEIRSWGPPAQYLCLTCARKAGALKPASSDNIKPSSDAPRAKQQGETLNLKRSDKHKREPERESAADAAIAEAHEATARRHARALRAKERQQIKKQTMVLPCEHGGAYAQLIEECLRRLRVIGSVEAGDRINTRMHYVYHNAWHARVFRSLIYTETREHTVSYVRQAVENVAVVVACAGRAEIPVELVAMLAEAARGACGGIDRLAETYASDVGCSATLSSLKLRLRLLTVRL
jgi:hypothetical protein